MNALQKVPLNSHRDNVTPAFLGSVKIAVLNTVYEYIDAETVADPWVQEAIADAHVSRDACEHVQQQRYGVRVVVAILGEPLANVAAEAVGYTVVHGGHGCRGVGQRTEA